MYYMHLWTICLHKPSYSDAICSWDNTCVINMTQSDNTHPAQKSHMTATIVVLLRWSIVLDFPMHVVAIEITNYKVHGKNLNN